MERERKVVGYHTEVRLGVPEDRQESSFMNATLQGTGRLAFSVAAFLLVPEFEDEEDLATEIINILDIAASAANRRRTQTGEKRLTFEVEVGLSREADADLADLVENDQQVVVCNCGCGATKPDDGRCECGQPVGHS